MTSRTRLLAASALSLALVVGAVTAIAGREPAAPTSDRVARGRYLVATSACADCHVPWHLGKDGPEPDLSKGFSGHPESLVMPPPPDLGGGPWVMTTGATNTAWAGPWGVSFTANLTPDVETGLGAWTEENFVRAIRTGRHMGSGRPILPPMPWPVYANFTDEDLAAIFAYLKSLPPVKNRVPAPIPPATAK